MDKIQVLFSFTEYENRNAKTEKELKTLINLILSN
jgi:hypothetical protein